MLTIRTLKGGGGASHYYAPEGRNPQQRSDEYYGEVRDQVGPTWWTPGGTLGVADGAPVRAEELREAMAGRDPSGSKAQLVQIQRRTGRSERDGGFDLHLAPPKGVSVLFAAADAETRRGMLEDMRQPAADTMAELHRRGAFVIRQGRGGATAAPAQDVVVALVPHQTARDGMPQIHVHCVLVNLGRREDGKTGALNIRGAFRAKGEAGALFRAGVAAALERRGVAVERVEGKARQRAVNFRVAGVTRELEDAFSGRKAAMVEYIVRKHGAVSENGRVRARQMQEAAQNTRGNKARVPTGEALEARWRGALTQHGVTPVQVWEQARAVARVVERPTLSAAEAVALEVRDTKAVVDVAVLRRRVAEEAQFRGVGVDGAAAEMARLERDGWQQVAREADRQQLRDGIEGLGEGLVRGGVAAAGLVAGRDGLLATFSGMKDAGGGGGGSDTSAPRKRRRGQDQGHER
jgi:conjugative relaxase-like TrwC/TraI family protein